MKKGVGGKRTGWGEKEEREGRKDDVIGKGGKERRRDGEREGEGRGNEKEKDKGIGRKKE